MSARPKHFILPAIPHPHGPREIGAWPAAFRRERLLIVGCGDVGCRVLQRLPASLRAFALTSSATRLAPLRSLHAAPLLGDLDCPDTLRRLAGVATRVLHLAPPASGAAADDPRTRNLLRALRRARVPSAFVYGSTSGVYGDCGGAAVPETRPPSPATSRAQRRLDAERSVRAFGRSAGVRTSVLRIPGIYGAGRPNGTPRERLLKGTPALAREFDVYTNHIHADDLARACIAALWRGRAQRVVNISDDSGMLMGDYFDLAADLYGLPRARRLGWEDARRQLSPMQLSFMSESRRLGNTRMKRELRLALRYPTVAQGLAACR